MATVTEYSNYEVRQIGVKPSGGEAYIVADCVGTFEDEMEVKVVTKNCRGIPRKVRPRGTGTRDLFEGYLLSHGRTVQDYRVVMEIDSVSAIKEIVANGLAVSIISHNVCREEEKNLAARAKAEKYAKILAKTIVNPDGDDSNRGQNAFFYDAAEGLLTSVILMLAEFLPPDEEHPQERRHIVSVFKLVQDLLEPSKVKGKSHFQLLMGKLPPDHLRRTRA